MLLLGDSGVNLQALFDGSLIHIYQFQSGNLSANSIKTYTGYFLRFLNAGRFFIRNKEQFPEFSVNGITVDFIENSKQSVSNNYILFLLFNVLVLMLNMREKIYFRPEGGNGSMTPPQLIFFEKVSISYMIFECIYYRIIFNRSLIEIMKCNM